jgi:hypothetical protein
MRPWKDVLCTKYHHNSGILHEQSFGCSICRDNRTVIFTRNKRFGQDETDQRELKDNSNRKCWRLRSVPTMELMCMCTGYAELQWSLCGVWKRRQTDCKCLQNALWDKVLRLTFLAETIESSHTDKASDGSQDVPLPVYWECKVIP